MGSFSSWNQPYVCNIHKSLYSGIRIRTPRTRIMVQQPFVKDVQHELHHVSLVPSPFQHKTRKIYNSNLVEVGKCDNNFYTLYSKELHSNLRRDLYAGLNCIRATKGCWAETANQVSATYRWIPFPQSSIRTSEGIAAVYEPPLYLSWDERERHKNK